jgi:hypothetical protein
LGLRKFSPFFKGANLHQLSTVTVNIESFSKGDFILVKFRRRDTMSLCATAQNDQPDLNF